MRKRTKIIIGVIVSLVVACVIALGFIGNYFYDLALNPSTDKSMIFNNEKTENANDVKAENTFFDDVSYSDRSLTNDNLVLHAYDFNQDSDTYVIAVHGYTSEGRKMGVSAQHFYELGYNVLVPDLRAHGSSQGDYIGMGWDDRRDIIAWIRQLIDEKSTYKIILYGLSMGAATVMNTLGEELPDNVKVAVEDCGYTSTWDIFAYQLDALFSLPTMPFLDVANIVTGIRAGYDLRSGPIDQIKKSTTPTLFIHGDSDAFVPSFMVEQLYDATSTPKEKLIIEGAGHAQSYLIDPQTYWEKVDAFVDQYLDPSI